MHLMILQPHSKFTLIPYTHFFLHDFHIIIHMYVCTCVCVCVWSSPNELTLSLFLFYKYMVVYQIHEAHYILIKELKQDRKLWWNATMQIGLCFDNLDSPLQNNAFLQQHLHSFLSYIFIVTCIKEKSSLPGRQTGGGGGETSS